jgi:hypothetical protein
MTVQLIEFCPSLQLLQSFFQNIALKWQYHGFNFTEKTFLRSVDPMAMQPKNVKFSH